MNKYFENQLTYHGLTVYFGNNPSITEREIHTYHEVNFYLGDDTLFLTERGQHQLKRSTLLIIPKETFHSFKAPADGNFLRVKISIPGSFAESTPLQELFSELRLIEKPGENIAALLDKIQMDLKEDGSEKRSFHTYSLLLLLLSELSLHDTHKVTGEKGEGHNIIAHTIAYISGHLADNLTIETLSAHTHYSPSSITHCFKNELGVSVHKYITMRRLILARNLIKSGRKVSTVHSVCGYNDYSSFYKAYIKFFGYPPSEELHNNTSL